MSFRLLQKRHSGETGLIRRSSFRHSRPAALPLQCWVNKSSGEEEGHYELDNVEKMEVAQPASPDEALVDQHVVEGLAKLFETAQLSQYLSLANDWCDNEGAAELREVGECFENFVAHLRLKPLEKKRLERALQAALQTTGRGVKETEAIAAIKTALANRDAGEMKLALSKASKLKMKGSLVETCREQHRKSEEAEVDIVTKRISSLPKDIFERVPKNVRYVLVSSPEHALDGHSVLKKAIQVVTAFGGTNKAGDAKDWFHSMMMSEAEMTNNVKGWRIAWKSKVCAYLVDLRKFFPTDDIVLLTIDGGPECQWELAELKGEIKKAYPWYQLLRFGDLTAFEEYFVGGAPLPSSV